MSEGSQPRIGRVLEDRFEISAVHSEDADLLLYSGTDRQTGASVLVRFLRSEMQADEEFVQHFRVEAERARALANANLAATLAVGEDEEGVPYLVSELGPGRPLDRLLEADGRLPFSRAARIGAQLLYGLAAAHDRGIFHGDLRPRDVLVEGGDRIKVLGVGVAKRVGGGGFGDPGSEGETRTGGVVLEALIYAAPEVIQGSEPDERTDNYSAGALVYEMLTGTTPLVGESMAEFLTRQTEEPVEAPSLRCPDAKVPPGLEKVVLDLLDKNPQMRTGAADTAGDLLARFVEVEEKVPAKKAAGPGFQLAHLSYLAGGALGGAGAAALASDAAMMGVATGIALGLGALIAFVVFPRVGEVRFWLRFVVVLALLGLAGAADVFGLEAGKVSGTALWMRLPYLLVALLTFALYSLGWGRLARIPAALLAAVLAPAIAVLFFPYPVGDEFMYVWQILEYKTKVVFPGLSVAAIGVAFGLLTLLAPKALPATSR